MEVASTLSHSLLEQEIGRDAHYGHPDRNSRGGHIRVLHGTRRCFAVEYICGTNYRCTKKREQNKLSLSLYSTLARGNNLASSSLLKQYLINTLRIILNLPIRKYNIEKAKR
jgi:hypothetical protein